MKHTQNRIITIAKKEVLHIIHDPRSLIIIFILPVIQLLLFGYALDLEIKNVDLAVVDFSKGNYSDKLIDQFEGSEFFHVFFYDGRIEDLEKLFLTRKARAILIINQDFDKEIQFAVSTPIQIIIDAADPNAGTLIRNYCTQVIAGYNQKINIQMPEPLIVESNIRYNPDMQSSYFFVPGILALLLVMICALLTSVTITREKELGTMEQILVSPIKPLEIILGKVLPYIGISILIGLLVLLIGIFVFDVPFRGSYLLLLCLTTLYIITSLSLGLMISTFTSTQQVAMMFAQSATLLPTVFLSGFIFPISSMPHLLQIISYIVPAKYFLIIVRGIILKGNGLLQLLQPTVILGLMSIILLTNAFRRFRLNLEE